MASSLLQSIEGLASRRKLVFFAQLLCLTLVALSLYAGRHELAQIPRPAFLQSPHSPQDYTHKIPAAVHPPPQVEVPILHNGTLSRANITQYLAAIMKPETTTLPKLECPQPDMTRYEYLQLPPSPSSETQYFFALDLREVLSLLPRLIGSVVETIRFLGPEHCTLSIVGGNSPDGTDEVLAAIRSELEALPIKYFFQSSHVNPKEGERIAKLAELRNLALQPLLDDPGYYSTDTTVIFLNDVAICMEDILELVHQYRYQAADMTCAFDWVYVGHDPTFYDVWIARTLEGDSFFDIPADGNWNSAWNLFWNNAQAQAAYNTHTPFQVFSCWDGATVFSAAPLLEDKISFRAAREGECHQGEPQLFCKDMWYKGHSRIAVVPSVHLEYSNERGKQIKDLKGYTSQWVQAGGAKDGKIEWVTKPPEKVKCMPNWASQFWQAWNETQP